jgi:hypothetical protein
MDSHHDRRLDSQHNRRLEVERLHNHGETVTAMAKELGVHRHTIRRDLDALQLEVFTNISDHDLDEAVAAEILAGYRTLGTNALDGRLSSRGIRVARDRLRACRRRLNVMGATPKRIKRLAWYQSYGPNGVWCMDQNEALQLWRISSFAILDGFSRKPVACHVTTSLSGGAHSAFFGGVVEQLRMLPRVLSVDKTSKCGNTQATLLCLCYCTNS